MNEDTAYKILGVKPNSDFQEIRRRYKLLSKRYHPDNIDTGDHNKFITISVAYTILQSSFLNVKSKKKVDDDIQLAIDLKENLEIYFSEIEERYYDLRSQLENDLIDYIRRKVHSTGSSKELKQVIKKDIAYKIIDTNTRLKRYFKRIEKATKLNSADLLFSLFKDMYAERRKYWLLNLYRNPILLGDAVAVSFVYAVKEFPFLRETFPSLLKLANLWWFPLSIALIGVLALLLQYILMNPRRQFVTPSFSIGSTHSLVKDRASEAVETYDKAFTWGGAAAGGIAGTFLLPGIGTIIGSWLGSLLGALFKSLDDIKFEIIYKFSNEIQDRFKQLDDIFDDWIEQSKESITKATFQSYKNNLKKVTPLLTEENETVKLLTG
ncbi:J domain-containing protein [uncultured Kordia sp.]|uniref:J domain-containing protein n=1 Tax=uncultured Kordia sp. TaxID=507699 RepID=UPI0026317EA9|nr:J domain-containing protein [uncultured Kordia sp.]